MERAVQIMKPFIMQLSLPLCLSFLLTLHIFSFLYPKEEDSCRHVKGNCANVLRN